MRSSRPHSPPRLNWVRCAAVATISGVTFALLGLLVLQPTIPQRALELTIRTDRDFGWEQDAVPGPMFTDGDLKAAIRWSTGVVPDREDLRRLRSALSVRVEQMPTETSSRVRIRLGAKGSENGAAVLQQLGRIALIRLHMAPWQRRREAEQQQFLANVADKRADELASQGELHRFVTGWIRQQSRRRVTPASPVRQPLNPRWEELLEKRERLSTRLEGMLETHRRNHPLVTRLQGELERLRTRLESTPRTFAQASASPSTRTSVSTIATGATLANASVDDVDLESLQLGFTGVWEQVLAARNEATQAALVPASSGPDEIAVVAWIESPAQPTRRRGGSRRAMLIVLAAVAGGIVISAADQHLLLRESSSDADTQFSTLERPLHVALALMAILTALLAMTAIHELVVGESIWLNRFWGV